MDARIVLLFTAALCCSWGTGSAVLCYQCSQGQPGCDDPFDKDQFTPITFDGLCVKFRGSLNLIDEHRVGLGVWRGPMTQAYYDIKVREGVPDKAEYFKACSSDKCNPAAPAGAFWTPLLLLLPAAAAMAAWRC